jgi:type I restriction enzyme S subunit
MKHLMRERNVRGYPDEPFLAATQTKGVVRKEDYENRTVLALKDLHLLKLVEEGDFVISLRSFQGGIEHARHRGIISPAYTILYPDDPSLHPYLASLFKSRAFIDALCLYVTGIRQGQNIDYVRLSRSPIPVPPAEEREAIARFVADFDQRCRRFVSNRRRLIEVLNEQKQIMTQRAIASPSTTLHRLRDLVADPKREVERCGDHQYTPVGLYNWGRGIFHKTPRRGKDLGDSVFFWLEEGDLVFSGQFAWEGAVSVARRKDHRCIASHRYPVFVSTTASVRTGYLESFFQSSAGQLLMDVNSRGAAGRNRPLNARALLREMIPVPSVHEQLAIEEFGDRLQGISHVVGRQITLVREYLTRLIADVVTGKVDVRGLAPPEPLPADEIGEGDSAEGLDDDEMQGDEPAIIEENLP